ncbi:MAG: GNAT family N-acetyltransferase, partial [Flavobacteriaceae bacterium]|nr:GNAT family N-acetyltransferase [Flavobacteriaceae bacterium]
MDIIVKPFVGKDIDKYRLELARLRIEVFREYPYLYDGTIAYEEEYLESVVQSEESLFVVAFDDGKVVGVSTGVPLLYEPFEVQKPWVEAGAELSEIYYFSESVLSKAYRGLGVGVKFFEEREKHARQLGYKVATFCGVIRSDNHPNKPEEYKSLDSFWRKRGYHKKPGYTCLMSWKDINEIDASEKQL